MWAHNPSSRPYMISKKQQEYILEYEKYKNIVIKKGFYRLKNADHIKYEVLEIKQEEEKVTIKTLHSENIFIKTLHWCRKNLICI